PLQPCSKRRDEISQAIPPGDGLLTTQQGVDQAPTGGAKKRGRFALRAHLVSFDFPTTPTGRPVSERGNARTRGPLCGAKGRALSRRAQSWLHSGVAVQPSFRANDGT